MNICRKSSRISGTAVLSVALLLFAGCASMWRGSADRRHRATSVVKYLYPGSNTHTDAPSQPVLHLPLRVGIAFVPDDVPGGHGSFTGVSFETLPEMQRQRLLDQVASQFRSLPAVHSIQVIPTMYLMPGGGFANLDQLKSIYGLDVVALVSFDQVQFTDEGFWSLTYWTVVGAYMVPAEKNSTSTLLDAAVYDIASRRLLFRAPGTSSLRGLATPVNLEQQLRQDSTQGFAQATTNMINNLRLELARFEQTIKERPDEVKIVRSPGSQAGAAAPWEVAMVAGVILAIHWRRAAGEPKRAASYQSFHPLFADCNGR